MSLSLMNQQRVPPQLLLPLMRTLTKVLTNIKLTFLGTILISGTAFTQELSQYYEAHEIDKTAYSLITDENKDKFQKIIKEGKGIGRLWQCGKNAFLFYDGWVFVGSKKDGSDLGVKPFNLVSIYYVKGDLIRFEFRGLPFLNRFELNTTTNKLNTNRPMLHTSETQDCSLVH